MNHIEDVILDRINSGIYSPGDKLDSERKLSKEFSVPQSRVRKTLRQMVEKGIIECLPKSGYIVAVSRPSRGNYASVTLLTQAKMVDAELSRTPFGILSQYANEENIQIQIKNSGTSPKSWQQVLEETMLAGTDGILIHPSFGMKWIQALGEMLRKRVPTVFCDCEEFPGRFDAVGPHHFELGFDAVRLMYERGFKRPLYIGYEPTEKDSSRLRAEGFIEACSVFGIKGKTALSKGSAEEVRKILKKNMSAKSVPDVIFAATKNFTNHATSILLTQGIKPGKDIPFLGTDEPEPLAGTDIKLTCIMRDSSQEAKATIRLMRERIDQGWRTPIKSLRIPPYVLSGKTLGE